jgi:hypothetical protein
MQQHPEESREQQRKSKKDKKERKEKNYPLESNEDASISSEFNRQYKKISKYFWILSVIVTTFRADLQDYHR